MIPDQIVNSRRLGGRIHRAVAVLTFLMSTLAVLSGCQQKEGIVTYKIPTKVPEQLLPGKDRMLAVIVPRGDKVWFFKVLGPQAAVDLIDDEFRRFVTGIKFDGRGEPDLGVLPGGWRRGAKKAMRFATIDINTPKKQLDLSISFLTAPEKADGTAWDAYVAQNVDRWRGQVGLKPASEKWSGGAPIDIEADQGESVWVDLVGQPGAGGATPMGAMPGMPPMMSGAAPGQAAGPNTAANMPVAAPTGGSEITFEGPEGWRKIQAQGMRELAFQVGPADASAEVTIITAGGDLRNNVARWMGQVAGGPPEDAAVDAMMEGAEKFEVSGRNAQRFVIAGDAEAGQNSIDATIVELGDGRSKFVKMTGDPKTVAEQTEAMRTFLDSLTF